jgi:hypothetical protein
MRTAGVDIGAFEEVATEEALADEAPAEESAEG